MDTSKSPERLVFFSDAVVAIAMTLLVLPLAEVIPELVAEHAESTEAFTRNQWQIYSFLLSFVVISRFWISHHHLFENVKAYSPALMQANLGWLLTIVVLPFPTEMIAGFDRDQFTALFYIGTVFASSAFLAIMVLIVHRNPDLARDPDSLSASGLWNAAGSTLALAVALILVAIFPSIGYYSLFLLMVPGNAIRIRNRVIANRAARKTSAIGD
jgi:uncharacterized membrane protein